MFISDRNVFVTDVSCNPALVRAMLEKTRLARGREGRQATLPRESARQEAEPGAAQGSGSSPRSIR